MIIIIIYSRHLDIFTKFLISGQKFCLDLSPDSQKTHKVSSKIIGRDRNIDVSWWTSEKSRKKKSKRHLDRKACVFWDQIFKLLLKPSATAKGKRKEVTSNRVWEGERGEKKPSSGMLYKWKSNEKKMFLDVEPSL